MAMDQFLAEYYGTAQSAPAQDDTEKTAQVELFAKLAAAEGIDLNTMSDGQVEQLFNATFSKEASDDGDDDDDKKEEAKKEHQEKKAEAEKFAEADYMGRVMAHAYVQEMRKIAESNGDLSKEAGPKWDAAKASAGSAGKYVVDKARSAGSAISSAAKGERAREAFKALRRGADASKGETKGPHVKHHLKELGKGVAATGGLYGGGAAAVGGAGYAAKKHMDKKGSALEELAGETAVVKAAEAGWDADEAASRVSALLTLGASDQGTKVAMAADVDQAIEIRASELLEQAGYPVDWS